MQKRRSVIPGKIVAVLHDVVALERGHRDEMDIRKIEPGDEGVVVTHDLFIFFLRPVDQVHLVHSDNNVLDTQQRTDEAVPPCLRYDPITGINQDNGQVTVGGARGHVACVLFVAGRVSDDKFTF